LGLDINSVTNKVYVANTCGNDPSCHSFNGTVTVIDGATNNTATVAVGAGPDAIAVNSATNKTYAANACGNDPSCHSFNGTVTVIDGVTLNTTTVNVGLYPVAMAVDSVTNKIYVCNQSDNTVTVIDGATNNTTTVSNVGANPIAVAVNSVTNKIYVPNACGDDPSCQTFNGTVTVIDGATLSTTTVAVGASPFAVAVNSLTNKIYVPNTCGKDPSCQSHNGTVTVIDGVTLATSTVTVGYGPLAAAVNSATDTIYIANNCDNDPSCEGLEGTVTVIDGATLSTTSLTVGHGPAPLGVNSLTNRIYVANQADNTVSVIAGPQNYKILHNFGAGNGNPDGFWVYAGLIMDAKENLYGTTSAGGTEVCGNYGCGTVFQMTPNMDGSWTENILYDFSGSDGAAPWAPVTFDAKGRLYGTTSLGGSDNSGTVFQMTPNANGTWTLSTLHTFTGGNDGGNPEYAGVTLDQAGHILGVASADGFNKNGVVFELNHVSVFKWYELVAHGFGGGSDGSTPYGNVILDASFNIYGTTYYGGGPDNGGIVYKLTPNKLSFGWSETILHSFTGGSDGGCLSSGLIFDAAGNLYGTTEFGGPVNNGTVFKMTPNGDGTWTETVLYGFQDYGAVDGLNPVGGVTFDQAGNLYGTTSGGGLYGQGIVFELSPSGGGQWAETILHSFGGTVNGQFDGVDPQAGVILDNAGNIYGTTFEGGTAGISSGGVVFEITR